MAPSNDDKNERNRTLITLAFMGVLIVFFVIVLGILPYRSKLSPENNGTNSSSRARDAKQQYQFGITDYMSGNYKAAIDDFTRAIRGQYAPLEEATFRRGLAYYSYSTATQDEPSLDNSIADFRTVLELNPN